MKMNLPDAYLELAKERLATQWDGYGHPEDFGYDFRNWVSPYTKGAHQMGGIAVVLQDWTGSETMGEAICPEVQEYGRTLKLKTNVYLEQLLQSVFDVKLDEVYGTNVFVFVKNGGISKSIKFKDIKKSAMVFTKRELEIVKPKVVLALGVNAYWGLSSAGIECIRLPHPAARIGAIDKHESIWRERILIHPIGRELMKPAIT